MSAAVKVAFPHTFISSSVIPLAFPLRVCYNSRRNTISCGEDLFRCPVRPATLNRAFSFASSLFIAFRRFSNAYRHYALPLLSNAILRRAIPLLSLPKFCGSLPLPVISYPHVSFAAPSTSIPSTSFAVLRCSALFLCPSMHHSAVAKQRLAFLDSANAYLCISMPCFSFPLLCRSRHCCAGPFHCGTLPS